MLTLIVVMMGMMALVMAANMFVEQSSALAKKLRVGDFLIGLTIVAFGTSLPELVSTLFSATAGHNQLVVANVIGSNMANMCLIFGVIAVFNDYRIRKRDVDINIPINIAAMMMFWALAVYVEFAIGWTTGISLILIFLVLLILSKEYNHFRTEDRVYVELKPWLLVTSMIVLIASGKVVIDQVIILAEQLAISETVAGYFLLAVGTSLPELVTTWVAVKKHDGELGVGNILGSNLFNLLLIFGVSSFVRPVQLADFKIDLVMLSVATLAVYGFAILGRKYSFSRREGVGLLLIYAIFVAVSMLKAGT